MSFKTNLAVPYHGKNIEVTVRFIVKDGQQRPCYYCNQPGVIQKICFIACDISTNMHDQTRLLITRKAYTLVAESFFNNRSICSLGSPCENQLIQDRKHQAELNAIEYEYIV